MGDQKKPDISFDKDLLYARENKMKEICSILTASTPVCDVYFAILTPTSVRMVCSNAEAAVYTLQQGLADWDKFFEADGMFYTSSALEEHKKEIVEKFGINYALRHVYTVGEHKEVFGFISKSWNKDSVTWYYNNIPTMSQFEVYFGVIAQKENLEIYPQPERLHLYGEPREKLADELLERTLDTKFGISSAEAAILKYYSKGIPPKDIALMVNRSHRTVENHLSHIKQKLNLSKKSELLKFCEEYVHI